MGFFSFKTADTKESIPVAGSNHRRVGQTVYLLQPNGQPPIAEPCYKGYGSFGEVSAHVWLAEHNCPDEVLEPLSREERRILGIALECGKVFRDAETGELWSIMEDRRPLIGGCYFQGRCDESIPAFGQSVNDLVTSGRLERVPLREVYEVRFPLKFSYSPDAVYEALPASEACNRQGCFY